MLTRPRTLPVGFAASLMAAMLLSLPEAASAQRSGVRSGVIGSVPTDSARSGVIGGGYRGAPIGRRERRDGSIRTQTRALLGPVDCGSGSANGATPPASSRGRP
jgi:hypothetical protein